MDDPSPPRPTLVSACLLGLRTRYDGTAKTNRAVIDTLKEGNRIPVPVCPEQLGGLSTPRPASCFHGGDGTDLLEGSARLRNSEGEDVSGAFLRGARETLKVARLAGCREAFLKERSPSCGVHQVRRGNETVSGMGVAAALLSRNDIFVLSEEDLEEPSPLSGLS